MLHSSKLMATDWVPHKRPLAGNWRKMMNANLNYSALKKAIGELTEVLDRSQPGNEEAGTLLRRMDSTVLDIEIRVTGVMAAHHTISSGSFLAPN